MLNYPGTIDPIVASYYYNDEPNAFEGGNTLKGDIAKESDIDISRITILPTLAVHVSPPLGTKFKPYYLTQLVINYLMDRIAFNRSR